MERQRRKPALPWEFSFSSFLVLGAALSFLSVPAFTLAQDPPTVPSPPVNQGAGTYIPGSATSSPAVINQLQRSQINVPTPDTIPPPQVPGQPGAANPAGIVAPSQAQQTQSLGQYRNARGEVRISKMLLDRYKQSVVRVIAKDLAGNELSRAMGVGIGRNAQYIATPLSIILGNAQQWADRIEITHNEGNKYYAKVVLIDEDKNTVLLAPEANPAPISFVRATDERPQISVYTISFTDNPTGTNLSANIHTGVLAAANPETGLLSVSGSTIENNQSGTAILNSQGELVGMLLPNGRGVLASTLQAMVLKAQKATAIDPSMIGVILGRGVLVDPKIPGAYRSINAALEAIQKGEAPKPDPTRYIPAESRAVAPKSSDKVVVKVMPGTYKEAKPISIPSNISLSGSGPSQTILVGSSSSKPVLLMQSSQNVMVSGFRIIPAANQSLKAPGVILNKSERITFLGNLIETKGGIAFWALDSKNVTLQGNTFARGELRAISCDRSSIEASANAFVGAWEIAFAAEKSCSAQLQRNLFSENKVGINVISTAGATQTERNSFIRNQIGIRISGPKTPSIKDSLFYECGTGVLSTNDFEPRSIGRNAIWKSKFQSRGRNILNLDFVRTEPVFEAPENFDFRVQPGKGQVGVAAAESGADLGAFQRTDFLGPYTPQLVRSLGAATGNEDLASTWGITP